MKYNCEGIFFILSFFILYILPFGLVRLRTFRLVHGLVSAWVSWYSGQTTLCVTGAARWLVELFENWRCKSSQHRKIVSLSPHVEKPLTQKGNKKFRTWIKRVVSFACISGFLCVWTCIWTLCIWTLWTIFCIVDLDMLPWVIIISRGTLYN